MNAAHGLPSTRICLEIKLNGILESIDIGKAWKDPYFIAYVCIICRADTPEKYRDGQKKQSSTGKINVRGGSHKRTK